VFNGCFVGGIGNFDPDEGESLSIHGTQPTSSGIEF
jgi:hypothetical protein